MTSAQNNLSFTIIKSQRFWFVRNTYIYIQYNLLHTGLTSVLRLLDITDLIYVLEHCLQNIQLTLKTIIADILLMLNAKLANVD